ncbi:hypothetical protein BLOT_000168 [Blomia tropicalis]|nr:hypothetical protein BLOT_000168 [Blomia tropicalis]
MTMRTSLNTFKVQFKNRDPAIENIEKVLQKFFPNLTKSSQIPLGEKDLMIVFTSKNDSSITFTLRYYGKEELFSLIGEACKQSEDFAKFNNMHFGLFKEAIEKNMENVMIRTSKHANDSVEHIPIIKRHNAFPVYSYTSDDRFLEYDFDELLVHERSQFQDIKIFHSPTLGNVLYLDDYQNLAEADINYTRGLMNYGKNDYKGKEILILGGGDGALLHELLKENPKFVTMVDIDAMVMELCQKYMRGACGSTLDSYTGQNYHVIVGDCIEYMKDYIKQGRSFDFVFNDLTDFPISSKNTKELYLYYKNQEEGWNFITQVLKLALQLVRADGKYLNHATGLGSKDSLEEYERILKQLPNKVEFTQHSALVPSFLEEWVFYEIRNV